MTRVRMIVAIDPEAGIKLRPSEPPPDVSPGQRYEVTCCPQQPCELVHIVVRDYAIETLRIGDTSIMLPAPRIWIDAFGSERRACRFETPIAVLPEQQIRILLRNAADRSFRPWTSALFVEPEGADDQWEPSYRILSKDRQ